jgi:YebC/PmpR family DNA-binding regulatory protein
VAILIEALTDNRNRTAADLRAAFNKNGGNLGETGCVGWMFDQKGVVTTKGKAVLQGKREVFELDEESLLEALLESGAETYELTELDEELPGAEVFTDPSLLEPLSQTLTSLGYTVVQSELRWIPNNSVEVTDADQARSLLKLMDALEDLDDVQSVTANFDMDDDLVTLSLI